MAYRLALPPSISRVYIVFTVSIFKRYYGDEDFIIEWDSILLEKNIQYKEKLVSILDRDVRRFRTKLINSVKVQWKHRPIYKATWKTEKDMHDKYPSCSMIQVLLYPYFSLFFLVCHSGTSDG